jgi:arylsulfatase A-like enzyme
MPPARRTGRVAAAALLALVAAGLAACQSAERAAPPAPRLVLLYAPCTVNKDYLSPYNPAVDFTPRLGELARGAVVFRRHQTEAGASGIAYASLFSGTQANRHGVFSHPGTLPDDLLLVHEAYAEAGYETFYWNGHLAASSGLNYAQGVKPENVFRGLAAKDERFVQILDRLRSDPTYKAFIVTNFTVTHSPYRPAPLRAFLLEYPRYVEGMTDEQIRKYVKIYRDESIGLSWAFPDTVKRLGLSAEEVAELVRVVEDLYRSNVNQLDDMTGAVVDAIRERDLLDESLLVFTADHGEALYRDDHRFMWAHSGDLNPEVLSVPLLIVSNDPRVRPAAYEGVTRSIDVVPTMLGLSGIAVPDGRFDGRDLSPVLTGRADPPDLVAYSHTQMLPPSVSSQMRDEKKSAKWTIMRKFHPRPDPELIWVAMRVGDRQFQYRKLDGPEWGFEAIDLANGVGRAVPFVASDAAHAETAQRLLDYKELLVRSYGRLKGGKAVPSEKEADILRRLGYIE